MTLLAKYKKYQHRLIALNGHKKSHENVAFFVQRGNQNSNRLRLGIERLATLF